MNRNRRVPTLWLAPLIGAAALGMSHEAFAADFGCGPGWNGVCFSGSTTSGNNAANLTSDNGRGVNASDTGSGDAVYASSSTGNGVRGLSAGSGGSGVYGSNSNGGVGVYCSCSGTGCWAFESADNMNLQTAGSFYYGGTSAPSSSWN
jgi:hypothetical protein